MMKSKNLVQDVSTHWNSFLLMLERLIKLCVPIYSVLHNRSVIKEKEARCLDMSDADWSNAESLVKILKPLQLATQALSGEYYPTFGNLYPIIYGLINIHLQENDEEDMPAAVQQAKRTILKSIKTRFNIGEENVVAMAATALHPCHKKLRFFTQDQKDQVSAFLSDEISKLGQPNTSSLNESQNEEQAGKAPCLSTDESAMKFLLGQYYEPVDEDCLVDEVQQYLSEKPTSLKPLEYWKTNHSRYPALSQIARKLLCIPATSTPAERVFSAAGNTVIPKRASLEPECVDQLVFLHSAMDSKGQDKLKNVCPEQVTQLKIKSEVPEVQAKDKGSEVKIKVEETEDPPLLKMLKME